VPTVVAVPIRVTRVQVVVQTVALAEEEGISSLVLAL
jgi:hypothetical protein